MISKKIYTGDGTTKGFLSDFIVRSEQYTRPYVFKYDSTLNIDGTEDHLVDGTTDQANWSYPNNLWVRGVNIPQSNDVISTDKWAVVDNRISFYTAPLSTYTVWIEVATVSEEFGDTLTQPSVERAETAAINSQASEIAAASSAEAAASSESNTVAAEASLSPYYDDINTVSTNIGSVNVVANSINTGTSVGGGQYHGNGIIKGIEYFAQEGVSTDNIVISSGTNAMSVDSFTVPDGGSITIENNATYKVI